MTVEAQTFAEWFKQKSTQKKYLLQQIAALQVYNGYIQKGYGIAKGGLGSIGGAIGSEYALHSSYYTHLQGVSAPVRNNPQVVQIFRWQQDILKQISQLKKQNGITPSESVYIGRVCKALLSDCDARLTDLQTVLADRKTEMSDEERMRQIARVHEAMQDNNRFAAEFYNQVKVYVLQKQQAKDEVNTLRKLYGNR
ncbi:hypothetical protein [Mucilaginibacter sp.]|uniref:hypothetical protein n=1 Tax=Mucilaginibacter sp. TaxID=1882438 RepID=UPI0032673C2C